jgi:3D (Asp-Asp-Asp) domain-containing protein
MARLIATAALALAHTTSTVVSATAYSPCSSGTITASGQPVHWGIVAANWLRLGTRIRLWPPVLGRTRFQVEDRVGYGTALDIWMPSCAGAIVYGRRTERVTIGWR